MNQPEVAIVILNWNQAEETLRCLSSLKAMAYSNYWVLVVDNGSEDQSAQRIARAYPEVQVIRNEQNLGFAEGCNVGIQKVLGRQTPYFLFLNNDTRIDPHCLASLVEEIEKEPARGIVGAMNYFLETPEVPWTCGHRFLWWRGTLERLLPPAGESSPVFEIQSISGSCFLVRRELFETVGLFDRRFFIYYEETDLCLRAARAGFKVLAHREAKVWHRGANTFGRQTPAESYLFTRNHLLCLVRHCPKGLLPLALVLWLLRTGGRFLFLGVGGRWREASAIGAGLWDFATGRLGEGRLARFSPKRRQVADE